MADVVVLHTLYNNYEPIVYIASMPVVGAGAPHSRLSHWTYIVYNMLPHMVVLGGAPHITINISNILLTYI